MAPINRKQYSVAQPGFIYISHDVVLSGAELGLWLGSGLGCGYWIVWYYYWYMDAQTAARSIGVGDRKWLCTLSVQSRSVPSCCRFVMFMDYNITGYSN